VDAGAYGCGTHQAVESGIKVADLVWNYQRVRRAVFGAVAPRREETR